MLIFGHLGTTLGAARVIELLSNRPSKAQVKASIDYRLVMLGAMLPDIIDKPLVLMLADKPVGSARFIAHSLIFIVVLILLGELYGIIFKRTGFLIVACASLAHIIEDLIWRTPKVLFWPYYNIVLGYINPSKPTFSSGYIENRVRIITTSVSKLDWGEIFSKPSVFIPELIGGGILFYFLVKMLIGKKVIEFIRTGRLDG
jgi:hypothetical protein